MAGWLRQVSRIPHKQAFLATAKLRADGTRVEFSQQDHDSLHLFDRADRFAADLRQGQRLLVPDYSSEAFAAVERSLSAKGDLIP